MSASELARRLEVTVRTVLRDMEALSAAGVPVYAERGRRGGFVLLPGYAPAPVELTATETDALFLAGGHAALERLGLAEPLASALRKLATGLPAESDTRVTRTSGLILIESAGFGVPEVALPHLDLVQQAVFDDRRLRFRYQPRLPSTSGVRTVDPYGLVAVGAIWYLIAAHRGRPRSYRLSRMSQVRLLSAASTRPDDLDLRALWRQMRSAYAEQASMPLRLRTEPRWTEFLLSSLGSQLSGPAEVHLHNGSAVIEGRVQSARGAAAMLAGFGNFVEVLEPPELRQAMLMLGHELVERYADVRP